MYEAMERLRLRVSTFFGCAYESSLLVAANRTGDCQWERRKNIHMPFADDKKLTGVTPDQCKKACEEEVTFHCMSFDYNYASSFCFLSRSSRYESILSPLVNYDYYERVCYGEQSVHFVR